MCHFDTWSHRCTDCIYCSSDMARKERKRITKAFSHLYIELLVKENERSWNGLNALEREGRKWRCQTGNYRIRIWFLKICKYMGYRKSPKRSCHREGNNISRNRLSRREFSKEKRTKKKVNHMVGRQDCQLTKSL